MLSKLKKVIIKVRKKQYVKQAKRVVKSYKEPLIINSKTVLTRNTFLGENTNFNGMRIPGGGKVVIGDNFHSGQECLIITEIHNYNGEALPYDRTNIKKDVIIEDNVWIGTRVLILGGVTIGEGAIVQAGSVVVSDIPKYGIAGGSPAKVFKYRDQEHYDTLKANGRFHKKSLYV